MSPEGVERHPAELPRFVMPNVVAALHWEVAMVERDERPLRGCET